MMEQLAVKHTLLSLVVTILLVGCAGTIEVSKGPADRPPSKLAPDPIDLLTGEALDADGHVPPRTNDQSTPSYALLETERLWQAIIESKNYAFVAVKSPGKARGFYQNKLLIGTDEVAKIKSDMLATIPGLIEAHGDGPEFNLPRTITGMVFPGFIVKLKSVDTLRALRGRQEIDYVEPLYYEMMLQSGCGYEPYVPSSLPWLQDGKRYSLSGGNNTDVVPYTFRHLGITNAWNRFPQPGSGIMVAVLDTGASLKQDQVNQRYSAGLGVSTTNLDSTGTGLDDTCGHGTKVGGILAAPNDRKNIVGVLYKANLTTVKVGHAPAQDVFSGSGWVCDGINKAINAGAQIINMSFGFLISSPTVEACIRAAFDDPTKNTIFVAAAGTGPQGGVIFPANMRREVVAVSAVDITGPGIMTGPYHMIGGGQTTSVGYGEGVDFASVYAANRMPSPGEIGTDTYVGQAISPGFPSGVIGQPYTQFAAGGGTSSATPTLSGVFGLTIQSQTTPTTRANIISQVARASTIVNVLDANGSQIGSGHIGAGIPNAYLASGGSTRVDIVATPGNVLNTNQTFTLTAIPDGTSPLLYSWAYDSWSPIWGPYQGNQTQSFSTSGYPGTLSLRLRVRDSLDPTFFMDLTKTVAVVSTPVPPPTTRTLSSFDVVYLNAAGFLGNRGDFRINQGWSMPAGCVVLNREGRGQYVSLGMLVDRPDLTDEASAHYVNNGFTVSTSAGAGPASLDTMVHLWTNAFNSIYVRVKYTVLQPAGVQCDVPGRTQ